MRGRDITTKVIIDTAFEILRKSGKDHLSIQSIAFNLHSSEEEVSLFLSSIDEIHNELKGKCLKEHLKYQTRDYTDDTFLNMGIGAIMFAKKEQNLNNFLKHRRSFKEDNLILNESLKIMKRNHKLKDFNDESLKKIFRKCRVFTFGLINLIENYDFLNLNDKEIIQLVTEIGDDFILGEKRRLEDKK